MRRAVLWALVLGALLPALGGCLAPKHGAPAAVPGRAPTPRFAPPALIAGGGSGETFIALGRDGLVLVCAHGGFTGESLLWISHDDGATWTATQPGPNPIPDGDCDVEVSPAGELAIVYDYAAGSSVAVSRDGGKSWTLDHGVAPPLTGGVDRPWIAYVGERLLLSYKAVGSGPGLVVTRWSDDHGATWSTPVVASKVDDVQRFEQLSLDFLVGADGVVRIPIVSEGQDATTPLLFRFAVSHDRGATWGIERAVGPVASDQIVGAAVAGNGSALYWAWHDRAGSLMESHSRDGGATWSPPFAVAKATTIWTPALAGRPDGAAALVWLQSGPDQAMAAILDASRSPAASEPVLLEAPNGQAQMAEFSDVAVGPDGSARIVYSWNLGDGSCNDARHPTSSGCEHFVRQLS